jgi:hypothetical protein
MAIKNLDKYRSEEHYDTDNQYLLLARRRTI